MITLADGHESSDGLRDRFDPRAGAGVRTWLKQPWHGDGGHAHLQAGDAAQSARPLRSKRLRPHKPLPRRTAPTGDGSTPEPDRLLELRGLHTHFFTERGMLRAVDGVDLSVDRQEVLGVVGESGCGKTMTARSILRLVPHPGAIVAGEILLQRRNPGAPGREMRRQIRWCSRNR